MGREKKAAVGKKDKEKGERKEAIEEGCLDAMLTLSKTTYFKVSSNTLGKTLAAWTLNKGLITFFQVYFNNYSFKTIRLANQMIFFLCCLKDDKIVDIPFPGN